MTREKLSEKAERLEEENGGLRARNTALEQSNAMLHGLVKTREDLLTDLAELGERRREEISGLRYELQAARLREQMLGVESDPPGPEGGTP